MRAEWIAQALKFSRTKAHFYSGCRKILRGQTVSFESWDHSLQLEDAGYTKSKMTMLTRNYLHDESRTVAIDLWARRRAQAKYGSVGFTCYAHFVKGGSIDAKRSKRASVFGPCIQSVVLTWLSKEEYCIDVYYRTTEWFKKFPADLVFLRDVLLLPFDFGGMQMRELTCHFANITLHPMYMVTILPHLDDPITQLEKINQKDPFFWKWIVKWSARYLCEEHMRGIQKFSQAMRVHKDANERIDPKTIKVLQEYLRENHPGFRNEYVEDEDE